MITGSDAFVRQRCCRARAPEASSGAKAAGLPLNGTPHGRRHGRLLLLTTARRQTIDDRVVRWHREEIGRGFRSTDVGQSVLDVAGSRIVMPGQHQQLQFSGFPLLIGDVDRAIVADLADGNRRDSPASSGHQPFDLPRAQRFGPARSGRSWQRSDVATRWRRGRRRGWRRRRLLLSGRGRAGIPPPDPGITDGAWRPPTPRPRPSLPGGGGEGGGGGARRAIRVVGFSTYVSRATGSTIVISVSDSREGSSAASPMIVWSRLTRPALSRYNFDVVVRSMRVRRRASASPW